MYTQGALHFRETADIAPVSYFFRTWTLVTFCDEPGSFGKLLSGGVIAVVSYPRMFHPYSHSSISLPFTSKKAKALVVLSNAKGNVVVVVVVGVNTNGTKTAAAVKRKYSVFVGDLTPGRLGSSQVH